MNLQNDQIKIFYDSVWNRYDKSCIPQLLCSDITFRGSLGHIETGHEGFENYLDTIHTALGGYTCTIEELVSTLDRSFARVNFEGIHQNEFLGYAPTGKKISWEGIALFTFRDGKISDLWVAGDTPTLQRQLENNANQGNATAPGTSD